jgi:hypothetical protein
MRCLHRVPGEAMMGLMSGVLGTHRGREPLGTWWLRSPPTPGGRSGTARHVPVPEPCRAVVPKPQSCGDARAFLRRGRAWRHKAHGDSGAFSCQVTGSVPRGTWQHRSPLLASGTHSASGHVATPEPFPGRWRALCHGTRGDTGALSWQVARSVPQGTWRHRSPLLAGGVLCASGHVAEPEPPSTGNGSGAMRLIF